MNKLKLEDFLNHKNLNSKEKDGLILFDYSLLTTFEMDWDEISLNARGIVFEKATGKLVARGFGKFFNWEEFQGDSKLLSILPQSFLPNYTGKYRVLEKLDGSCAICYTYMKDWNINTRGSFESEQAIWAKKWFDKNIDASHMNKDFTYVFEIIYPDNRIVVDYGNKEMLSLTAIIDTETGYELPYDVMKNTAERIGCEIADIYEFDKFEDIFTSRDGLTMNEEGYVVTFDNGFKFKLKGEEYSKVHKLLCSLTPLHFWRAIDLNTFKIPKEFLVVLPEEFKETVDTLQHTTERLHADAFDKAVELAKTVPEFPDTKEGKKERYFWVSKNFDKETIGTVMGIITGSTSKVRESIHRKCRPTNNRYENIKLDKRLLRIIENVG